MTLKGKPVKEHFISIFGKRSVTRRWLLNTFLTISVLLVIIVVTLSLLVKNFYYSSIEQTLIRRATITSTYFTATAGTAAQQGSGNEFLSAAQSFIEGFEYRDKVELQFIGRDSQIAVTSSGFEPTYGEQRPDYYSALASENGTGVFIGDNALGERILAVTQTMSTKNGTVFGAVRVLVSLTLADRALMYITVLMTGVAFIMLFLVLMSSLYFIRSIVNPVKGITATANTIAQGNFEVRHPKAHDDEVGDLVDSINTMAAALGANERLKNDFISSVSHELRTPLTAIKGWGETIRDCGMEDEETFEKGMGVIIKEAERLSGLVEELLDFSRLQSGRLTMSFERLDVLAELADAVYFFTDRAAQEEKELTFYEPDSLPPINGDRNRLRQVFVNLIDNAMKYSEKGGKILVNASLEGESIVIMVRDFGCGIAPEDVARVTQRFYKANNTKRGFGIGLGVAEEIITAHKGEMKITSKLGEGTVVAVTLPVAPPKQNTGEQTPASK